jgi:hypothetical protein
MHISDGCVTLIELEVPPLEAIHDASMAKAGWKVLVSGHRQFKSSPGLTVIYI